MATNQASDTWWAVPEGTIGQFVGMAAGKVALYHVVQSSAKPASSPGNPVYGPYATRAQAQQQCNALNGVANAAVTAGENTVGGSPLAGLAAIGDFFGRLGQAATWIRVAEVMLGALLIAVGVAKLTRAVPIATSIAGTVGGIAP